MYANRSRPCLGVCLEEGVLDLLHAIHRSDETDLSAATDHQAELPRLVGEAVGVLRVPEVLDAVVQDEVVQLVEALPHPVHLAATLEPHLDLLVAILR